jgi:hypothetical protein
MEGLYHELTWINLKKKIIFKVLIFYEKKILKQCMLMWIWII